MLAPLSGPSVFQRHGQHLKVVFGPLDQDNATITFIELHIKTAVDCKNKNTHFYILYW